MRNLVFAIVFVCPPFLKILVLRWLGGAKIGRHVRFGWFSTISGRHIEIGDYSEIRAFTAVRCNGEIKIGAYSIISNFVLIYGAASFNLGRHCYIGPQCLINVDADVTMGNVSALGPRCMVFTHGSFLPHTEGYWTKLAGVTIGNHAWIAAGVFIHPGVKIGDDVFVNSRSVVTQDIASGEAFEGFPAQRVTDMNKLKRRMTPQRRDAAVGQILKQFGEMRLQGGMGITVQNGGGQHVSFKYRNCQYVLMPIFSENSMAMIPEESDCNFIFLVNRADWLAPAAIKNVLIFDFTTMRTRQTRDQIHAMLWEFMRMYFGVTFEYE